jgi:hypothetical protein
MLFVGPCVYVGYTRIPPKEAKLLQNFNEHRAAFEQLRDMLLADEHLRRVAGWGVDASKPFPTDRLKKYQALLEESGGKMATRSEGEHPDPGIIVWAWGWAGNTRHIGIFIGWTKSQQIRFLFWMVTRAKVCTQLGKLHTSILIRTGIFGRICKSDQVREWPSAQFKMIGRTQAWK